MFYCITQTSVSLPVLRRNQVDKASGTGHNIVLLHHAGLTKTAYKSLALLLRPWSWVSWVAVLLQFCHRSYNKVYTITDSKGYRIIRTVVWTFYRVQLSVVYSKWTAMYIFTLHVNDSSAGTVVWTWVSCGGCFVRYYYSLTVLPWITGFTLLTVLKPLFTRQSDRIKHCVWLAAGCTCSGLVLDHPVFVITLWLCPERICLSLQCSVNVGENNSRCLLADHTVPDIETKSTNLVSEIVFVNA